MKEIMKRRLGDTLKTFIMMRFSLCSDEIFNMCCVVLRRVALVLRFVVLVLYHHVFLVLSRAVFC